MKKLIRADELFCVDANLSAVFSSSLKAYNAFDLSIQGVISASPNIVARVDFRSALANDDGAGGNTRSVSTLDAQSFCL